MTMAPQATPPPAAACTACGGTGTVPDIYSQPRPCSRCNWTAFDGWRAARAPRRPSAGPTTPSNPGAA